jgi:hypothetical protein
MDAYLRDTGIEMETYAVNGQRVRDEREYEQLVRAVLVAYVRARSRPER